MLTPIVGQDFLDKYHLRDPLNRTLRYGVKTSFSVAGATTRQFKRIQGLRGGPTRLKASGRDYFDLTPDDDQKMIVETVDQFAQEILRPAAPEADEAAEYPRDLITKAAELGVTAVNVPEDFDGIAAHRSSVTNVLVAEALAYGDMGLALPILARVGWPRRSPIGAAPISRPPTSRNSPARTSRRPASRSPNRSRCSTRLV
ncbi:acyl-CoA dehydrogenase, N-terminal domain protein [Mycobacterium xenopi 3993]|nr:acyl-CoA dehydrogenase, N-terminal domain protein [Mycobacterium xenopi 3993]